MKMEELIQYVNRGRELEEQSDFAGAKREYFQGLEIDADMKYAYLYHFRLGLTYKKEDNEEDAIKHLRHCLELIPMGAASERAKQQITQLASMNLGKFVLNRITSGANYDINEPIRCLEQVLKISDDDFELHEEARALLEQVRLMKERGYATVGEDGSLDTFVPGVDDDED